MRSLEVVDQVLLVIEPARRVVVAVVVAFDAGVLVVAGIVLPLDRCHIRHKGCLSEGEERNKGEARARRRRSLANDCHVQTG